MCRGSGLSTGGFSPRGGHTGWGQTRVICRSESGFQLGAAGRRAAARPLPHGDRGREPWSSPAPGLGSPGQPGLAHALAASPVAWAGLWNSLWEMLGTWAWLTGGSRCLCSGLRLMERRPPSQVQGWPPSCRAGSVLTPDLHRGGGRTAEARMRFLCGGHCDEQTRPARSSSAAAAGAETLLLGFTLGRSPCPVPWT